ncbi:MAG: hypothetical protein SGJ10_03890 [Bacteroidota bacterium]|nr:hypothetical protein [Bacteroidota bacterium]
MSKFKIDEALKKALGDLELPIDKSYWQGISDSINSKPPTSRRRPFLWVFIGVSLVSISSYYLIDANKTAQLGLVKADPLHTQSKNYSSTVKEATHDTSTLNKANNNFMAKTGQHNIPKLTIYKHDISNLRPTSLTFGSDGLGMGKDNFKNTPAILSPRISIFASMLVQEPDGITTIIRYPEATYKRPIVRPQKQNHQLNTASEVLVSGGFGFVSEKPTDITTSSITHKDYKKVWSSSTSKGISYNLKMEYYQPLNIIKGIGISAGANYIQSIQQIAFNYIYSEIPVRDSATKQILGYVKLPNNSQQIIPNSNVTNTELTLLARVYYTPIHSRLMDCKVLFGASVDVYSKSKGVFYDIDKANTIEGSRKHSGMLIPEWGIAFRYYLSEHSSLNIGYSGRISKWNLSQYRGNVINRGLQQNLQIGIGFNF